MHWRNLELRTALLHIPSLSPGPGPLPGVTTGEDLLHSFKNIDVLINININIHNFLL